MATLTIEGTKPDGSPYREAFNSYYLAIVQKNKLTEKGYKLELVQPEMYDIRSATTLKYSRKEKDTFKKLKRRRNNGVQQKSRFKYKNKSK